MNLVKYKSWHQSNIQNGIITIKCNSWPSFQQFMNTHVRTTRDYIWRGHENDKWLLLPSLDRKIVELKLNKTDNIREKLLKRFKHAMRGRGEKYHKILSSENEWWALGQNYVLITPLLDWSSSPFIANYFAFENKKEHSSKTRTIYGLSVKIVTQKSKTIEEKNKRIEFVSPLIDDNARLIHQRGLFTKAPIGTDIESWVKENISNDEKRWVLIKILMPEKSRDMILRSLERMGISSLELFPDIYGACQYCNLSIDLEDYCQLLSDENIFEK